MPCGRKYQTACPLHTAPLWRPHGPNVQRTGAQRCPAGGRASGLPQLQPVYASGNSLRVGPLLQGCSSHSLCALLTLPALGHVSATDCRLRSLATCRIALSFRANTVLCAPALQAHIRRAALAAGGAPGNRAQVEGFCTARTRLWRIRYPGGSGLCGSSATASSQVSNAARLWLHSSTSA